MSSIPQEIYHDIFLRLPMKSLLVSKCVCKTWYALISSSNFVNAHVDIQKNNPLLILELEDSTNNCYTWDCRKYQLYSTGYDSFASPLCEFKDEAVTMDYPFKSFGYGVRLLGSCNGLVSIWLFDNNSNWPIPWNFLCLWNPATREYKEIPKPPNPFNLDHVWIHAFAYDHKTDDYKLAIGVKARRTKESSILFQVYTLSSNSWKIGQTVPFQQLFQSQKCGVFFNGDLHWLTESQDKFSLLSFDISDESFKELQLPKELLEKDKALISLGELEGCLSVLVRIWPPLGMISMELWVMLDYGVWESWTKRYVIADCIDIGRKFRTRLVWSFKNGEILLFSGSSADMYPVLYDPKHGSYRKLKNDNIPLTTYVNYFESLVSLNSGTYVGNERHGDYVL